MAKRLRIRDVDVDAAGLHLVLQANERRYYLLLATRPSEAEIRDLRQSEFLVIGVKGDGRLTMQSGSTTVEVVPHRELETWELRTESRLLFVGGPGNELHRWLPVPWYKTEIEYWMTRLRLLDWLNRRRR